MKLRIALFAFAALLLAAHFLRAGDFALVALCVAAPFVFLHRRRRSLILLQVMAFGAAAIWAGTALRLVQLRLATGQPWTLAVVILGGVGLYTAAAGLLLASRSMRERYPV